MNRLPFLAQRLFNVPIAIMPDKAEVVIAALADRLGVTRMFRADGAAVALADWDAGEQEQWKPYEVIGGVAVIPVRGTLVQELGMLRPWSGMTGYDGIRTCFMQALHDPTVDAIVFDINSPGGEVAGCFDLVDTIYEARGLEIAGKKRPIWAILSEVAYSAAYAIASAADHVTVPRTGGTGSVGVICMHVDFSKALGEAGVTVTLIQYGARKADGTDVLPLSKEALDRFQADIDAMGELFVTTVARNRGLSPAAVRATQAATFLGGAGVKIGFADAEMAPDAAFNVLLRSI